MFTEPEQAEPRLTEVTTSVSSGGKFQLVKFSVQQDYSISESRKWSIPSNWTEEDAKRFQAEKTKELRAEVDAEAQEIVDGLLEQKEQLNA